MSSFVGEVENASCELDSPTERIGVDEAFISDQRLHCVQYAGIQETYERYFFRPTVFDYDELLSADNRNAMRNLFETLKTNKDFYLPFFSAPIARTLDRFLNHNGITIYSQRVPERTVVLRPVTMNEHAVFDKATPIGRIYDGYIRELFAEELSLVTLPPFEASETAKRQVDAFLRGFFYPLWRKNHEIVSPVIDGFRVGKLSRKQKSLVKERLAPDTTRFFEMNPDLANRWGPSWESP